MPTTMKTGSLKLTHADYHKEVLRELRQIFIENSYPVKLVNDTKMSVVIVRVFATTSTLYSGSKSKDSMAFQKPRP